MQYLLTEEEKNELSKNTPAFFATQIMKATILSKDMVQCKLTPFEHEGNDPLTGRRMMEISVLRSCKECPVFHLIVFVRKNMNFIEGYEPILNYICSDHDKELLTQEIPTSDEQRARRF